MSPERLTIEMDCVQTSPKGAVSCTEGEQEGTQTQTRPEYSSNQQDIIEDDERPSSCDEQSLTTNGATLVDSPELHTPGQDGDQLQTAATYLSKLDVDDDLVPSSTEVSQAWPATMGELTSESESVQSSEKTQDSAVVSEKASEDAEEIDGSSRQDTIVSSMNMTSKGSKDSVQEDCTRDGEGDKESLMLQTDAPSTNGDTLRHDIADELQDDTEGEAPSIQNGDHPVQENGAAER